MVSQDAFRYVKTHFHIKGSTSKLRDEVHKVWVYVMCETTYDNGLRAAYKWKVQRYASIVRFVWGTLLGPAHVRIR